MGLETAAKCESHPMTTEPLIRRKVRERLRSLARAAVGSPIPPTLTDLEAEGIPASRCVTVLRGLNNLRAAKAEGRGARAVFDADSLAATWAAEFGTECTIPDRSAEVKDLLDRIPRL